MKNEFKVIADLVEKNTRVLDVGCADGVLMEFLRDNKNIDIRGLEISKNKVQKCIEKGITVIEGNAEFDLKQFPDKSFDFVVLSQTLQALFNTEKNNDERIVWNLGFGKRTLSDDKLMMTGINAFLDFDDAENVRASLGVEARNAVLEFSSNYYLGIADATDEKVLDGYDLRLASQIPYLHWANAFVNSYKWSGEDRNDIEGIKLGSEIFLSPTISLETAFDDKDKAGLEDEWYARLLLTYPPRQGPTAQDGISSTAWKTKKDMSDQLLTKVKRQNKIMVEFDGLATISRLD